MTGSNLIGIRSVLLEQTGMDGVGWDGIRSILTLRYAAGGYCSIFMEDNAALDACVYAYIVFCT